MARLGENRYGKSRVRLSRITRRGDRHEFNEWTVRVLLRGDFESSFTQADNSKILPTDTMKNTVYFVARNSEAPTIEEFVVELGNYLLGNNPQVSGVRVEIQEKAWERMVVEGKPEATTFRLGGAELQTADATRERDGAWSVASGVDGLVILKTTKSAFTGYIKDKLTTLKPATDRIFGTSATVKWEYAVAAPDYAGVRERVIAALLKEFAAHDSMSVQHTLFDMGKAALAAAPEIARITLAMPNLHHLLADLGPFGLDNPNHIFVPIDEPHGYIEATIER
ncbi:MAG: factor-independent urate hydroxylase [Terracidiphilus sp.]|jgi:urate oxidase